MDVIIRNAEVLDGSGSSSCHADIGLQGGGHHTLEENT